MASSIRLLNGRLVLLEIRVLDLDIEGQPSVPATAYFAPFLHAFLCLSRAKTVQYSCLTVQLALSPFLQSSPLVKSCSGLQVSARSSTGMTAVADKIG